MQIGISKVLLIALQNSGSDLELLQCSSILLPFPHIIDKLYVYFVCDFHRCANEAQS